MTDWLSASVDALVNTQRPDGGWAHYARGDSAAEPTAAAVAALFAHNLHPLACSRGLDFIRALQQPDGSIRPQPSQTQPTTIGAMAATVLLVCGSDWDRAARAADYLLSYLPATSTRTRFIEDDSTLRGFAWRPGSYSWVEPTAYGMILLYRLGRADHPRLAEAKRVLFDRAIPGSAWNYGNSVVLGARLEPVAMPTALALLALWDESTQPAIHDGIAYLESVAAHLPSPLSAGWVDVALRDRRRSAPPADRYADLFENSPRAAGSPWHRAAALLAVAPLQRIPFVIRGAA